MACNQCNDPCKDPCEQVDCTCRLKISTDCSTYTGNDLECSGIKKGTILTELIQQLDAFICTKFDELVTYFRIDNTNVTGARVYKGINGVGTKLLRRIATSPSIIVTENTDDIVPTVDEDWLDEYLGTNPPCITSPDNSLTIDVVDGCTTIQITSVDEGIPRFIVNSAYTGQDELGTISQPFKDIPQAIDAFLLLGQPATIQIQKGVGYTYSDNIAYDMLTVELETGAFIVSTPTAGWFCDTTVVADGVNLTFTLILNENSRVILSQNGFRNPGTNTNNGAYTDYKKIIIKGGGDILQTIVDSSNPNAFVVFESNYGNTTGMHNDSVTVFETINIRVSSQTQPLRKIGGDSRATFDNTIFTVANPGITPNIAMVPFQQTGGDVVENGCTVNILTDDLNIYTFAKDASFACNLRQNNCSVSGNLDTIYTNTTALKASLQVTNSGTSTTLNIQDLFKSPLVIWNTIIYHNNYISYSVNELDSQIDLTGNNTISVSNKIGGSLIESLVSYLDRASAEAALPKGSKFINRNSSGTAANWTLDITMT